MSKVINVCHAIIVSYELSRPNGFWDMVRVNSMYKDETSYRFLVRVTR